MENSIISKNLRHLRISKAYTQEYVGEQLGVSPQSVSRWECGNTLPDVLILPEIAKLYCITIDDLFKENSIAYKNYAQRLMAVYEATDNPEDFIRADVEYKKLLQNGDYTTDDLHSYGVLHQYMMNYCKKKAISLFNEVIDKGSQENEEIYYRTMRQKIYLFSQIGKSDKSIEYHLNALKEDHENPQQWILLIAAYHCGGQNDVAYDCFKKAIAKFPNVGNLYVYGGDICRNLKKYEEAFLYWDKALALDDSYFDAKYSKGFCYQELRQWEKAYGVWCEIVNDLDAKGYHIETAFPKQLAKECKKKM